MYVFVQGYRVSDGYNNHLTQIDPATEECTRLDANADPQVTGDPPSARSMMGFTALDGVLWVFGGHSPPQ